MKIFANRRPDNNEFYLNYFKKSEFKLIDTVENGAAKKSLLSGEKHLFCLLESNNLVICNPNSSPRSTYINHAMVASTKNVYCAGEIKLHPVIINGKKSHALDINNSSGHYKPDASNITSVMNQFEKLGFPIARVQVVRSHQSSTKLLINTNSLHSLSASREYEDRSTRTKAIEKPLNHHHHNEDCLRENKLYKSGTGFLFSPEYGNCSIPNMQFTFFKSQAEIRRLWEIQHNANSNYLKLMFLIFSITMLTHYFFPLNGDCDIDSRAYLRY